MISALPDSPAQKAGLQLGDVLEKIAGFTTGQMAIEQAQLLLSGDPGTVVKLSVIRRGKTEPEDVNLTLEKLPAPKLVEDKIEGDIAYFHVPEFIPGMTKHIRDELSQFEHQGAHKLILDLRDCSLATIKRVSLPRSFSSPPAPSPLSKDRPFRRSFPPPIRPKWRGRSPSPC